jgi:hypothetical protein
MACDTRFEMLLLSHHGRKQLGSGWVEVESSSGEIYYANIETKQTSWVYPLGSCSIPEKLVSGTYVVVFVPPKQR